MKTFNLNNILRINKSIFTFKEIILASGEINPALLRRRLHYYIKKGDLYSVRRGLYAKDRNYDKFELAVRIFKPSYISLETVLAFSGIIFQKYTPIFIVSYQTKEITCDDQVYSFRKIRTGILTDTTGIECKNNYWIASPERALLDILYLNKEYHFDNTNKIDWDKVYSILPIYGNKRMKNKVNMLYKAVKNET